MVREGTVQTRRNDMDVVRVEHVYKDYLLGDSELPLDVENPAIKEMNVQLRDGRSPAKCKAAMRG